MIEIIKRIELFYKDYLQPIPENTWSSDCVRSLVKRKYRAKHHLNKIAFLGYAESPSFLHQLRVIMDELDPELFDVVTISLSKKSTAAAFKLYSQKKKVGLFTINALIKERISYKLVVMIDPPLSGVFYDEKSQKFVFGMELIGEQFARMMFILGASNWMFNKVSSDNFDYIFVPGRYHKKKYESLKIKAKILTLGSPRFDRHLKCKDDFYREYQLDYNKQIFLWLPTHTNVSSFPDFIDLVATIRDRFNIIFKPHDNLRIEIKNINEKILSAIPKCRIIGTETDSLDLINCSDIVACDYGGSVFSAINLDKNVLLFNTDDYSTLEAVFRLDTPELELRNDIVSFSKNEEKRFLEYIFNKNNWEEQRKIRVRIRERFFCGERGSIGKNIASYLRKIVEK